MGTYDLFTGERRELGIDGLRERLTDGFAAAGISAEEAELLGSALVEAELRSNPTHGLLRFAWYVDALRSGVVTAVDRSALTIERHNAAVRLRGTGNFGYLPTLMAVDEVAGLARKTGIAIALVSGISEFGRAALYSRRLADQGMIGIAMQNSMTLLKPPGGTTTVVGTNPLAYSVPGQHPLSFDASFTPRSGGELHLRRVLGIPIDEEWGYTDKDGNPTMDPGSALEAAQDAVGGAKGFGIAVLIDVLAGALAGARSNVEIRPGHPDVGAVLIAIDPAGVGSSQSALNGATVSLHDAIIASGGRWLGARSDREFAEGLAAGILSIPVPLIHEVDRTLSTLGLPSLAGA